MFRPKKCKQRIIMLLTYRLVNYDHSEICEKNEQ